MAGKLYGIGVGPGDPELLTLKAIRVIDACSVIAVPAAEAEQSVAYKIVDTAYREVLGRTLEGKTFLGIHMPMTKDKTILKNEHEKGINVLRKHLDDGQDVAFLTLGDPTVYSTYIYLHKEIERLGYEVEIVSGIPSFCAAAARANMELAKKEEQIHILPASYRLEEALELPGTKILMKAGKKYPQVKAAIQDQMLHLQEQKKPKHTGQVLMLENCGMENEHMYRRVEDMPEQAGYYTLIIVKDEGTAEESDKESDKGAAEELAERLVEKSGEGLAEKVNKKSDRT
jgi:precorrin-2/cobalt-factor-2 C20-methyltransferase